MWKHIFFYFVILVEGSEFRDIISRIMKNQTESKRIMKWKPYIVIIANGIPFWDPYIFTKIAELFVLWTRIDWSLILFAEISNAGLKALR